MSDSLFHSVQIAPDDPILGLSELYRADTRAQKVNLGVGVYLTEQGNVPLLKCVAHMEKEIEAAAKPHGYIPIGGLPSYCCAAQKLLLGAESEVVKSGRAVTVQTLGGTGALSAGGDFLHLVLGKNRAVVSKPTWGNHISIFEQCGFEIGGYAYYDKSTETVNFEAMMADLKALSAGTVVILHACCHNPTGVDLTIEQWKVVLEVVQERNLIPFLDIAYQGFGAGLESDAAAVRLFAQAGISFLVASSFSKSFNLYGERIGALTVVTQSADEAQRVLTQLKAVIRSNYSNPPTFGARIVDGVLNNAELFESWRAEVSDMRSRIKNMRQALSDEVGALGHDFTKVIRQNGMFSFTGLTPEQMDRLREDFAIYGVRNGRICVAGLNTRNVKYVAQCIAKVL